jgi:hypothetical protein
MWMDRQRQTDMMKLVAAFQNFANITKHGFYKTPIIKDKNSCPVVTQLVARHYTD